MKLRQRLFLRRFLPIWGTIGILFSLVVTISFGIENIYQILMLVGISVFCALLSATNAWNYCLMLDWIALSLNMAGTFLGEAMIITVIIDKGDCLWKIILPVVLLTFVVNYLILRKRLSSWNHQLLCFAIFHIKKNSVWWRLPEYWYLQYSENF